MSILSKVKSLVPASSRSLHAMYRELGQMHGQMGQIHAQLGEMWAEIGQTRIMVSDLMPMVERLRACVSSSDMRMMMLLWELYRKDGEELDDAKRRLVTGLAPATGVTRMYQLASAQLLYEFDGFCHAHGLSYWLQSGTLLGAVRHGGFIPWDDDLDVAMTRSDVERAIRLASDDPRYRITVRYDYCVRCRQVRFRYRDEDLPCFIDLFIFDPVATMGEDAYEAREAERAALRADLDADEALPELWNAGMQFMDENSADAVLVRRHFDLHVRAMYDAGVLTESLDEAEGVIWAIDNVDSGVPHHSWYLCPKERVLPLGRMAFEGHEVSVPSDPGYCLESIFGNIYDLPARMDSYFDHQLGDSLNDAGVRKALEDLAARGQ